jgi:hypothetical protein
MKQGRRPVRLVLLLVSGAVVLTGCGVSDDVSERTTTTTGSTTTAPTTAPEGTEPPGGPSGAPVTGCTNGWKTPAVGSPERQAPLDIIRDRMGVEGLFKVEEMRYFTGPEVPWVKEPRPEVVERWYVKASLVEEPSFQARWIVERRDEDRQGIAAVAKFTSSGYLSPDWRGFVGDGEPQAVPGLPGTWTGVNYDFVTGEGDSGNRGLPDENEGCMLGT